MMTKTQRKLMLRACPRCRGDLLRDAFEDEYFCLQCGRRADPSVIREQRKAAGVSA